MSIAALQKLLHILSNKTTAQFYMSVRSEQDGCRVVCTIHWLLPKHKPCTNWDCHTWCRIIVIWQGSFFFWFLKIQETQGKHLTRKSSLLKTWMSHFKLSQDLDESFSSLQDLDESFSTLSRLGWVIFESSRLGWVIFNSLKTWMSHFQVFKTWMRSDIPFWFSEFERIQET